MEVSRHLYLGFTGNSFGDTKSVEEGMCLPVSCLLVQSEKQELMVPLSEEFCPLSGDKFRLQPWRNANYFNCGASIILSEHEPIGAAEAAKWVHLVESCSEGNIATHFVLAGCDLIRC